MYNNLEKASLPASRQEFTDCYLYPKPRAVLFEGAAKQWQAMRWSPNYLLNTYGERTVPIQVKELLTDKKIGTVNVEYKYTSLREYLENILGGETKAEKGYISQVPILKYIPELRKEINFPSFYNTTILSQLNIWIGPAGTKSKLHYDSNHNLFAQIYGEKQVTLISSDYYNQCYPVNTTWYDGFSPIDIAAPDYDKYPDFQGVPYYQAVIKPGDILFIPRGWWHDIRSLSSSISLNLWWITPAMFIKECVQELWYYAFYRHLSGKNNKNNSYLQTSLMQINLAIHEYFEAWFK